MATSHYCNGKWKPGPVAGCPKHKRLDRKQPSVYRSDGGDTGGSSDGGGGDSGS